MKRSSPFNINYEEFEGLPIKKFKGTIDETINSEDFALTINTEFDTLNVLAKLQTLMDNGGPIDVNEWLHYTSIWFHEGFTYNYAMNEGFYVFDYFQENLTKILKGERTGKLCIRRYTGRLSESYLNGPVGYNYGDEYHQMTHYFDYVPDKYCEDKDVCLAWDANRYNSNWLIAVVLDGCNEHFGIRGHTSQCIDFDDLFALQFITADLVLCHRCLSHSDCFYHCKKSTVHDAICSDCATTAYIGIKNIHERIC